MKKLIIAAAVALTAIACNKKENTYEQDTNVMLAEPEVKAADSATAKVDQTAVQTPAAQDTTAAAAKVDSAK